MEITCVKRDSNGVTTSVGLEDGTKLSVGDVVKKMKNGEIFTTDKGKTPVIDVDGYIRSYPNGSNVDNLDKLPSC